MSPSTSPTRISDAALAPLLRRLICSTGRRPLRLADGRGIRIASSAAARPAESTVLAQKNCETLACETGGGAIPLPLQKSISAGTLNKNMALRLSRLKLCERPKAEAALSASGAPRDYSWITAISRGISAPYSARHAIRSSDGTRRRRTQSCASRATSKPIDRLSAPCHADVLLEIANA
jgi:hypothetical protein